MVTLALQSKQTSITAQTMRWPCKLFSAETSQFKQPSPRRRSLPKHSADRERSDRLLVTYVKRESSLRYGSAPYPEQPRRGRYRGRFFRRSLLRIEAIGMSDLGPCIAILGVKFPQA
jgi:hypothetical protein